MNRKWPVFLAISALRLNAQVTATTPRELAESGYRVRATSEHIRLDARFSEPVWATTDSIVDFRQREPLEGAPATERTVVKIIRDAERLYVAIRAYDHDVRSIRSAQLRRDADLSSDDNVTLLVDSYRDRRGAFLFRTNPNGAMWDAQLIGLDNVNENWNGIWEVVTRRDSVSWSAEFAIPLRTLAGDRLSPHWLVDPKHGMTIHVLERQIHQVRSRIDRHRVRVGRPHFTNRAQRLAIEPVGGEYA